MRFVIVFQATLILLCRLVYAQTATLENLYTNPKGKKLPEAVIFYNSANTCENCDNAIRLLETTLKNNYEGQMHAYLIDIEKHPEFISAFSLSGPLTLVIIRISDGAAFGYKKLTGLQSIATEPRIFSHKVTEFINNFLGF